MIYITGDTHGAYNDLVNRLAPYSPSPSDTVIVAGDFGFIWSPADTRSLEQIKALPYTVAFVDGNHENFDMLGTFPVEEWHGGNIHRISDNVIHLMRGQLFEIEGKTIFTMGGAYSVDKMMRKEGRSWWRAELPSDEEYRTAAATLEKCGYKMDCIITHTLPSSAIIRLVQQPDTHDMELTGFLEWLYRKAEFKMWFGGHFHEDRQITDDICELYESVREIE